MSKRFGRNQRRRAREAIATLQGALSDSEGTIDDLRSRLFDREDEIRNAKAMVAPFSSLFSPSRVETERPAPRSSREARWQVDVTPQEEFLREALMTDPLSVRTMQVMELDVFLATVEPNALSRKVHVILDYNDRTAGYAINEREIASMRRQDLARYLGQAVIPQLVNQLMGSARR